MKLYDFTMAPNPRRVRIFLAEKGIEVETEQVDIPAGQNIAAEFRAINPRALLPTLVLDDGTVIDESVAILPLLRGVASGARVDGHRRQVQGGDRVRPEAHGVGRV